MKSSQVKQKYLDFFKAHGHIEVPSAPLVPENDPTTLFTSSGMQPMLPYFLGEPHPSGKRIVDSQKIFRALDIEEVGDNRHTTFFEMLGNWSFGDYFKNDQLFWCFEFLTKQIGIDPQRLYVSVFIGDEKNNLLKDIYSVAIWKKLFKSAGIEAKDIEIGSEANGYKVGMQGGRIFYYDSNKNWWSRAGAPENMPVGEPGGPDSEVFYEFVEVEHDKKYGEHCHPNCDCGKFLEIGNSVFMQYQKQPDGSFKDLPKKNVDFGGGLERIVMASNNQPDIFKCDLHLPLIKDIEQLSQKSYQDNKAAMRIIADHLKGAVFMADQGLVPSNKQQGYVMRRLIRRAITKMISLDIEPTKLMPVICQTVLDIYKNQQFSKNHQEIANILTEEINKFLKTVHKGMKLLENQPSIDGKVAFDLYQTYGFPLELTEELVAEKGVNIGREQFRKEFEKHQQTSRTASAGMFKGGLQDQNDVTTKYHTATHLLQAALRKVLGNHVKQMGSNITSQRMRFDFSHTSKMTDQELEKVEQLVNQKIQENLPVAMSTVSKDEALNSGALAFFGEKYPDKVQVYTIGDFSKEICGGPHVTKTSLLGSFKITKEESAGSGIRRIYATMS